MHVIVASKPNTYTIQCFGSELAIQLNVVASKFSGLLSRYHIRSNTNFLPKRKCQKLGIRVQKTAKLVKIMQKVKNSKDLFKRIIFRLKPDFDCFSSEKQPSLAQQKDLPLNHTKCLRGSAWL
jgi:hypothetical protein